MWGPGPRSSYPFLAVWHKRCLNQVFSVGLFVYVNLLLLILCWCVCVGGGSLLLLFSCVFC